MNQQKIQTCYDLILEYKKCERTEKEEVRNKLFLEMKEYIIKWISSISSQKGEYLTQKELQSKSWDCFLFALKYFKTEKSIPIPNHFYAYTRFKLSMKDKSEKSIKQPNDTDILDLCDPDNNDIFIVYGHLEELSLFRRNIPIDYQKIFDDALYSMMPGRSLRKRRSKEVNFTYPRYLEAKKIFKMIIEYLLLR